MGETDGKDNVTRAEFVGKKQVRIGGDTQQEFLNGLKTNSNKKSTDNEENQELFNSSPLLISTPPTISRVLVSLYPYLIIWDSLLGILTWTCDDIWPSVLMVLVYFGLVFYLETIIRYFGHLFVISIFLGYSRLDKYIEKIVTNKPTLENIVVIMDRIALKSDILLSPFTNLNIKNVHRILLTALLLSPVHIFFTWLILPPQKFLLLGGLFVITYHSPWSKVTRRLLWKFRFIRLLIFYVTGLDLGGINIEQDILTVMQKQVSKLASAENEAKGGISDDKPIRFTYVLYENQRRWLGIGWKASMLSYERTPWTDEFLNEAPAPDHFQLPGENSGMQWRWIDKTWRLDLTNDGAITLSDTQSKTTATPEVDDGYLYYDNQWKKPSIEETFSKYTRRRRWVRTAELIKVAPGDNEAIVKETIGDIVAKELTSKNNISNEVTKKTTIDDTKVEESIKEKVEPGSNNYEQNNMTSVRNRNSALTSSSDAPSSDVKENGIRYVD